MRTAITSTRPRSTSSRLDENTGAERKKAIYILVQASDLNQAAKNLAEGMRGTVSDYEVASIVKTPIVDAYKIAEK